MTLVEFYTQERDLYKAKKEALSGAIPAQQDDVKTSQTALKTAQSALAAIEADITAKRSALARSTIPAEAQALVEAIRDLQIEQRTKIGEVHDAQEAFDGRQRATEAAGRQLTRITARLGEAEANLKAAEDAEKRRNKLKERVTTAPAKDVPAQATAARTGPDHNQAQTKIEELPAELLALAKKRYDVRVKRQDDAVTQLRAVEDERVAQREAWGGEGKLELERTEFARAERAVQLFASTAQHELSRAQNIFKSIHSATLLSAAETSAVAANSDRVAAVGNADSVVTAQGVVAAAARDVENTEFSLLAANTETDLDADAGLTAKKATLATASSQLDDAKSAANYPDKATTDQWQIVVTDNSWKKVVDFYDAEAALDQLAGMSGTVLVTDMETKEGAYAAALADLATARRRLEYVDDVAAARTAQLEALTGARATRVLSAVRGDSY